MTGELKKATLKLGKSGGHRHHHQSHRLNGSHKSEKEGHANEKPSREDENEIRYRVLNPPNKTEDDRLQTVLFLHGCCGSSAQFLSIMRFFSNLGYRAVAPNIPGWTLDNPKQYTCTMIASYVKSFLYHLNLKQPEIVVCHSAGAFLLPLIFDTDSDFSASAFVFLSPAYYGKLDTVSGLLVPTVYLASRVISSSTAGRFFIKEIGYPIAKTLIGLNIETSNQAIQQYEVAMAPERSQLLPFLKRLRNQNCPRLMLYSKDDPLIRKEEFQEMATELGCEPNQIILFDEYNIRSGPFQTERFPHVYTFRSGGHLCFAKKDEVVKECLKEFMKAYEEVQLQRVSLLSFEDLGNFRPQEDDENEIES